MSRRPDNDEAEHMAPHPETLRRRRTWVIAFIVAACVAIGGGAWAITSHSSDEASTALPSPAFSTNGQSFYSEDQINTVWVGITTNYPEPLPERVNFPTTAPAIFVQGGAKKHLYETGLPKEIAAQFWRCAWVDVARDGTKSAKERAHAQQQMRAFVTLPGIKGNPVFRSYQRKMTELAAREGVAPLTAEFRANCGNQVFTKKGETK
ncbi:hypothetical protein [Frondihabitans sp. VKM Ac-2883]|uniref:hypothetical protein n=1 Tax=Frondihabitans sp. VKM Ac-2883 TaxID=2783823 RepID=UPI00188A1753|nr:hypothetical protein [Frondihabitans sp. VKM Ac-2883]MBF4575508.1 hypothetical protein [Frondihabitans sp. VKM Ac-2883]